MSSVATGVLKDALERFIQLGLDNTVDFDTFNRIAIVHHGSAIEGSTLTLEETQVLLTDGITAKGKPLEHHLMVKDHLEALVFVLEEADKKTPITPDLLKEINALVNKNTGKVRNTPIGTCYETKGDYRLGNVTAGSTYFVNYDKVIPLVTKLCERLNEQLRQPVQGIDAYLLSFEAHYYLVSIHPWFDGNGRTSRLLMNLIQRRCNVPLTIVFAQDKADYIVALNKSRDQENLAPFYDFMALQSANYLQYHIDGFEKSLKGISFTP